MDYLRALIGICGLVAIAYALSGHRKSVDWKLVATGILLQDHHCLADHQSSFT